MSEDLISHMDDAYIIQLRKELAEARVSRDLALVAANVELSKRRDAQARIKDLEAALRGVLDLSKPDDWLHEALYMACLDAAFVLEGKKGPVGKKPEVASPPPAKETETQNAHD